MIDAAAYLFCHWPWDSDIQPRHLGIIALCRWVVFISTGKKKTICEERDGVWGAWTIDAVSLWGLCAGCYNVRALIACHFAVKKSGGKPIWTKLTAKTLTPSGRPQNISRFEEISRGPRTARLTLSETHTNTDILQSLAWWTCPFNTPISKTGEVRINNLTGRKYYLSARARFWIMRACPSWQ